MKKLYVVRGKSGQDLVMASESLWVSPDFEVTMLYQNEVGSWRPDSQAGVECLCYSGFRAATGLEIEPGEYIEIEVGQV